MKTPEEKEIIVKRYLNGETPTKLADEYEINTRRIYIWSKNIKKVELKVWYQIQENIVLLRIIWAYILENLKIKLKN